MKIGFIVVTGLATMLSQGAMADPAYDLWAKGQYESAIQRGLAENTPEGLSVAARAAASDMSLHTTPCMPCIQRAETLSRKALAADPKAALPTIYLVAAIAYRSRLVGFSAARAEKLAGQSKQALDDSLAAHPDDAELIAALGGWHFEIVRTAGGILASWTYGATVAKGIEAYERALRLSPHDPFISYQYALGLASIDADEYRDRIDTALKRVVADPASTAFEETQKKHADELLALLEGGEKKAFVVKLDSYMGIPD